MKPGKPVMNTTPFAIERGSLCEAGAALLHGPPGFVRAGVADGRLHPAVADLEEPRDRGGEAPASPRLLRGGADRDHPAVPDVLDRPRGRQQPAVVLVHLVEPAEHGIGTVTGLPHEAESAHRPELDLRVHDCEHGRPVLLTKCLERRCDNVNGRRRDPPADRPRIGLDPHLPSSAALPVRTPSRRQGWPFVAWHAPLPARAQPRSGLAVDRPCTWDPPRTGTRP